jgi:formylglycine-generating enzyme required for sulfatase activity
VGLVAMVGSAAVRVTAAFALCASDAVAVGGLCVDKYEASVWSRAPGDEDPGIQYGTASDDYPCADSGQDCDQIFAASVAGAMPSGYATWFQAQQACANVGKRLLTNAEWQLAVRGTPDAGPDDGASDCNTFSAEAKVAAGSRSECRSTYGAYDMVGNLAEWVADWAPRSAACTGWGDVSDDEMCFAGATAAGTAPGVLIRGGDFTATTGAGPLSASALVTPSGRFDNVGFRCVR